MPTYRNDCAVKSREHFCRSTCRRWRRGSSAPTLMFHSQNALSPVWARAFHDRLAAHFHAHL
jgi:hypothetical protein